MSDTAQTIATSPTNRHRRAPSPSDGLFLWYELMTDDAPAAVDFYRRVVGWEAADAGGANGGYTILSAGDRGVAGVLSLPADACAAGARPAWLAYIQVADVDATAERIVSAGGSIHRPPADIPTVGRFAVVADPGGAVFQLLSPFPEDGPPPADPQAPGLISWRELYAGNGQEAAFAFYSGLFGWETMTEMPMGEMGVYRIFGRDGVQMGGMMDKPADMPAAAWGFYFNVEAIDAAAERVRAAGGRITVEPHEVPGGSWIVQGVDAQGASFALVAPHR